MARRKRPDAQKLKTDIDAIARQIAELEEKKASLTKEREEAERAEIVGIVLGAGLNADELRMIIREYLDEIDAADAGEADAPERADGEADEPPENPPKDPANTPDDDSGDII
jgi:hypothetical protein